MKACLTLMLAGLLCGCQSQQDARNNMLVSYPSAEVYELKEYGGHFIVRETSGDVWLVRCDGLFGSDQIWASNRLERVSPR